MKRERISAPDEYPGPEQDVAVVVEAVGAGALGAAIGRLVPPPAAGGRCALWTGVELLGHEIVIDLDWSTLARWVPAVLAARQDGAP